MPILLPANQPPDNFYAGGARISAFRSAAPCSSHQPEDWIPSTTCCNGRAGIGRSRLPDGTLLADAVATEPEKWLGPDHVAKYGADTKLLVKLLDAGQRLPVHAHPHVDWAARHLQRSHGKAEAWYILTPGPVWLGLREAIDAKDLLELVESERGSELLDRMHKIDVVPHQTVYVPPGTLHAIGEGIMVAEVQEPEDLSVLCEWRGFEIDGKKHGHLGLGFATALTAVDTRARTKDEVARLVTDGQVSESVLPAESQEYFVIERQQVKGIGHCRRGFAILIVLEGDAHLATKAGANLVLAKGSTVVIPFEDGDFTLEGNADVLIARPPQ
ncbi:putative mannose-6-phosphate isomerase GmuF [Tolypocladium ophioglossoides CBS 100239]|uniref:Putative mannose-6-phosphate isomerase GmuF n=1 Tax=Tolypocladium ophioglossoides (strain CBS 100239) TaxID=1163406 RepID=A0A0L0N053_TOLOC|nr:putative mannose-6-phosphate isomerase GmuF [Tolypocladium ophioglossoides CBS 100239]